MSKVWSLLFVYFMVMLVAAMVSTITRINGENCRVVVADYVFLGLTRLPCTVGEER